MALYVDWGKIDPPLSDFEKEHWAFGVGIGMCAAGMPAIKTDDDITEMMVRAELYGRLFNRALIMDAHGTDKNTVEFWRRWRGVSVNANKESRTAWVKRMTTQALNDIERRITHDAPVVQVTD